MADQQNDAHDPSTIRHIQTYVDGVGREIHVSSTLDHMTQSYAGQIVLTQLDSSRRPIGQTPLMFNIQASSILDAFVKFDAAAQAAYNEAMANQTKARHEDAGKIIIPG